MKKYISLLLATLLCFMVAIPCFAANVTITPTFAKGENSVTVSIPLPKNSGVATLLTTLHYDKSSLSLQSVDFQSADMTAHKDDVAGAVKLSAVWANAQTSKSTLCVVTFALKDGAKEDLHFYFTDTEATDQDDQPLSLSFGKTNAFLYNLKNNKTVVENNAGGKGDATGNADSSLADTGKANIPNTNGVQTIAIVCTALVICACGVVIGILVYQKKKKA